MPLNTVYYVCISYSKITKFQEFLSLKITKFLYL